MFETWRRWQDWAVVVVGVLLFIAPFAFHATLGSTVAWTAWVGGVLLVIGGLWSLSAPATRFTHWVEVLIGVLVFIAPWVLGFLALTAMAWSAWILGALAVILAGWVLLSDRQSHQLVAQH
jgi:SPW repeat-containing protein